MAVRDLRRRLTAGEVMTSDVSTVSPETPGGGYGFVLATARAGPRFPVASPPQGGRTHLVQPLR